MKLLHLIRIYSACKFNRFFPDFPMGPKRPEKTQLSGALAIVNAIYDILVVDFMKLAITPKKILDALDAKKRRVGRNAQLAARIRPSLSLASG